MSLEAALEANTKAVNALAALLAGKGDWVTQATADAKAKVEDAVAKRGVKVVEAPKEPVAPAATVPQEQSKAQEQPAPPAATGPLEYVKDVQALARAFAAKNGRDKLVEIFAEFGVTKGPDVPVEKLPELITKLKVE